MGSLDRFDVVSRAQAVCTRGVTVIKVRTDKSAHKRGVVRTLVNGRDATGDVLNAYREGCANRVAMLVRPEMRFDTIDHALFAVGEVGRGKPSVFVVSPDANGMRLMDRLESMPYDVAPERLLEIMRNPPDHITP